MKGLFWCEIAHGISMPPFKGAFQAHILAKKHPQVLAASLSAWSLLALAMREGGMDALPEVAFTDTGKPYFANCGLHFSLSHSGSLAAAAISDAPCAVDLEMVRRPADKRLIRRCLNDREMNAGCDFFDVWTKKECIAKLDGRGMPAHPNRMDTLDACYENRFFTRRITDSTGNEYVLNALDGGFSKAEKKTIIVG